VHQFCREGTLAWAAIARVALAGPTRPRPAFPAGMTLPGDNGDGGASTSGGGTVAQAGSGLQQQQHFSGNPLDRHAGLVQRFQAALAPDKEISLIVVAGREVAVRQLGSPAAPGVQQDLQVPGNASSGACSVACVVPCAAHPGAPVRAQALLLPMDDPELDLRGEQLALNWRPSENLCGVLCM